MAHPSDRSRGVRADFLKTLHKYLLRQVVAALVLTVLVFTGVMLLGNVLREVLMLLVGGQASFGIVARAIGLLIPFVLVYALPMGMLTSTLLVFGRFSADQELTAARASGIGLLSLAWPILLFSLALCGVCASINLYLGPMSRVAYLDLIREMRVQLVSAALPEGRYVTDIPGFIFYVGRNDGRNLSDVMVYLLQDGTNVTMKIRAPRGYFEVNVTNQTLEVHLFNARALTRMGDQWLPQYGGEWTSPPLDFNPGDKERGAVSLSDMTFTQLRAELRKMEQRLGAASGAEEKELSEALTPLRVQLNREVAFSFACFGFTLLGIPLGVRMHRRETNVGIAVALVLVIIYYGFVVMAGHLDARPEAFPQYLIWVPDFLFQAVGAVLLLKANRGF